jgi:hypothetical protein
MSIDVIPKPTGRTRITATTSGTAQTVVTIPDGSTYNVRLSAVNNIGSDAQKIYFSQDGTNFDYKIIDDGEEIILLDVVLEADGADIDFDCYGQADGFTINPLVFEIVNI